MYYFVIIDKMSLRGGGNIFARLDLAHGP